MGSIYSGLVWSGSCNGNGNGYGLVSFHQVQGSIPGFLFIFYYLSYMLYYKVYIMFNTGWFSLVIVIVIVMFTLHRTI